MSNPRSAIGWSAVDIVLRQVVQFAIVVALARMLSPEEFGTIALLSVFVAVAAVIVESGMSTALIRSRDPSPVDESTVQWFNVGAAVIMGTILAATSPLIATLFHKPILKPLACLLALNLVVVSFGSVHRALMVRAGRMRALVLVSFVGSGTSGAVAIILAAKGFGVWALAAQALTMGLSETVMLWLLSHWRPRLVFDLAAATRLYKFGGFVFASSLLDTVYSRLYSVFLGRLHGLSDLGFYVRAETTSALPNLILNAVISKVALPHFAKVFDDVDRLRTDLRVALQSAMLFGAPAILGVAAVAPDLVYTLFGAKWSPSAPILRVLCLGAVLLPLHVLNLQALLATGRSGAFLGIEAAKKVVGTGLLLAGLPFGAIGVAWGVVAANTLGFLLHAWPTRIRLKYGPLAQLRDLSSTLAAAIVMAVLVFALAERLTLAPQVRLAVCIVAGGGLYVVLLALFRPPAAALLLRGVTSQGKA